MAKRKSSGRPRSDAAPAVATSPSRRRMTFLYVLVIVTATAAAYSPVLRNDFVNWDDGPYVYQNAALREWSLRALGAHFVQREPDGGSTLPKVMGNYHPLTMVSLHVDHRLSARDAVPDTSRDTDLRATVFHATNVLLHVANTVLVFLFLRALLRARSASAGPALTDQDGGAARIAFVGGVLFGLATLHVESVAWVSERKDVLYAFFFFLALLAWVRYRTTGAGRWYAFGLAAFVLSLLSKGQAVTLPAVLLLVDVFLRRPWRRRQIAELLPFFALAVAFGALAVRAQGENVYVADAVHPWWMRPLFASYGLAHYAARLVAPIALQVHYTYAQALRRPELLYAVCPLVILAAAALITRARRRVPAVAFGAAFLIVNVLPVLQLLPVGTAVMADRYTYVASLGFFLVVAVALDRLVTRRPHWRRPLLGVLALYVLGIGVSTASRAAVWRDSETLWTAELRRDPRSSRAHNNLGIALRQEGRHPDAERHFRSAVEIDPANAEAWNNLGLALVSLGRWREAAGAYERALASAPDFVVARVNRAEALARAGEVDHAVAQYRDVLRVQPRYHVARGGLIAALLTAGRLEEAEAECRAGLALEPGSLRYSYELGRVLVERGAYEEGLDILERVSAADPSWAEPARTRAAAWNELAIAERKSGRTDRAEQAFRRALKADPESAATHGNLGALLASLGRESEAAVHLREAARLEPEHPEHARALAWLLATGREAGALGTADERRRAALRAVDLTQGRDALALYALARIESFAGDRRRAAITLDRALEAAQRGGNERLAAEIRRMAAGHR